MRAARFSKFGARRTECLHGHKHASAKEARRCNELHLLARAGEIADLRIEPFFPFVINGTQVVHANGRRVGYRPDSSYTLPSGRQVVEDVKGGNATRTEAYALRRTLFRALYPAILLVEL